MSNKMKSIEFVEQPPTLKEYNQLRREAGWGTYEDLYALQSGLDNSLYHIGAREGNATVGMGRVIGDGTITFYIQDLIVKPEYQGLGIGSHLMQRIMVYLKSKAAKGAVIGLMSARGKEAFYEKFGFIGRPNDRHGKGMTMIWENWQR